MAPPAFRKATSSSASYGIGTAAVSDISNSSKGGRDNSANEINAMSKPDRLGKVRKMVQLKKPLSPVMDKRTAKQKLRDAQARKS